MFRNTNLHTFKKLTIIGFYAVSISILDAQVGMGLSPLRVELKAAPNGNYSNSLLISNETQQKLRIRSENLDFLIDDSEQPQFRASIPEQAKHSCREWLKVNPSEFELAAGEHKMVRYSFRFPGELAEGSYECALGFSTVPSAESGTTGVITNVRLITAFYATNGVPLPIGEIKSIKMLPPSEPDGKRRVLLYLENKGTTYFRVLGSVDILSAKGQVLESVPFHAIPVLPGRNQPFSFSLHSEPTPSELIRARIDIGGVEIQEVTSSIEGSAENVGEQ